MLLQKFCKKSNELEEKKKLKAKISKLETEREEKNKIIANQDRNLKIKHKSVGHGKQQIEQLKKYLKCDKFFVSNSEQNV